MVNTNYNNTRRMPFTKEQILQAYSTNLIEFVREMGLDLVNHGTNNLKAKGHGGLTFLKNGQGFMWHSRDVGGSIVDFVKEWHGVAFKDAIEIILGTRAYDHSDSTFHPYEPPPKKELILPPRDDNMKQVYAYLCKTRGIEPEVVSRLMNQKKIYQTKVERDGKTYRNCAFVGYDMNKNPKYCALRSPSASYNFRQDVTGSEKSHGFRMEGRSERVYVFEAPIDCMSHASLCILHHVDWESDHRVSEGGLSDKALTNYLKEHTEIKEIVFCYDNDIDGQLPDGTHWNHGQKQAEKSSLAFEKLGYRTLTQTPRTKDFNSDLLLFRQMVSEANQSMEVEEQDGDMLR